MRSRLLYVILTAFVLGTIAVYVAGCGTAAPTIIPSPTPAPPVPVPSPTVIVDTPAYNADQLVGIAMQQPDVKSLYAAAETTKDYIYPEVKDFNWTANYLGASRWIITFTCAEWDYNVGGYVGRVKNWFFDESTAKLTAAS